MLLRAGQDVLTSARSQRGAETPQSGAAADLSSRRKIAVKKAFKRLDPLGNGHAAWEEVKQTLTAAPLHPVAQQKLINDLERLTDRRPDGIMTLPYSSFASYYYAVSQGIPHDGDFEQLLHAQWGYSDVSDILASMQKQFAFIGLTHVFQDAPAGELSGTNFEAALRRAGLQPRRDDVQRICRAFNSQEGNIRLDDFKDQILSPRPETPPAVSRDVLVPGVLPVVPAQSKAPAFSSPALPGMLQAQLAPTQVKAQLFATASSSPAQLVPAQAKASPFAVAPNAPAPAFPGMLPAHLLSAQAKATSSAIPAQAKAASLAMAPNPPMATSTTSQSGPLTQSATAEPQGDEDLDAMLSKMEEHLHHLKKKKADTGTVEGVPPSGAAQGGAPTQNPAAPISDADLDAALSHMENQLGQIKAHHAVANATPHWDNNEQDPPPLDVPQWEPHKYGHHDITQPAWKPQGPVTDLYGEQHTADQYTYQTYGAGAHGHHLAHYHLNDYQGLPHHSFQQEQFQKQQFGDASHHGHWVPHLNGVGTQGHQGEHSYQQGEYQNESYGKQGDEHPHWVPHLHGLGEAHANTAPP